MQRIERDSEAELRRDKTRAVLAISAAVLLLIANVALYVRNNSGESEPSPQRPTPGTPVPQDVIPGVPHKLPAMRPRQDMLPSPTPGGRDRKNYQEDPPTKEHELWHRELGTEKQIHTLASL